MHHRLYAGLSVVQIINRLRPRQGFQGRKYQGFVQKQIRLMQERGVVPRSLKPSDHVLLAKLVYPRPPISLPVPTVPREQRQVALLHLLSRCRHVHRSSPEAQESFDKLSEHEETAKAQSQLDAVKWMIETEDGSRGAHAQIAERIGASLAEHGTVLPAVASSRARMEWPCVRLLTDRRFGILFVECIELSVREYQRQVAIRQAEERALVEAERRRRARESVPNYLSACIKECAEQTRKVRKSNQWDRLHARRTTSNQHRRNSWAGRGRHYDREEVMQQLHKFEENKTQGD